MVFFHFCVQGLHVFIYWTAVAHVSFFSQINCNAITYLDFTHPFKTLKIIDKAEFTIIRKQLNQWCWILTGLLFLIFTLIIENGNIIFTVFQLLFCSRCHLHVPNKETLANMWCFCAQNKKRSAHQIFSTVKFIAWFWLLSEPDSEPNNAETPCKDRNHMSNHKLINLITWQWKITVHGDKKTHYLVTS